MISGRRRIRKLIDTWVHFGEFLKSSLGKPGVPSSREEEFLKLKARIAHLLPVLSGIERGGEDDPETRAAVRDITQMLNSFTVLATPEPINREAAEEVIARWHRIYMFLYKLEGGLRNGECGLVGRDDSAGMLNGGFLRFVLGLTFVGATLLLISGLWGGTLEGAKDAFTRKTGAIFGQRTIERTSDTGTRRDDNAVTETHNDGTGRSGKEYEGTRARKPVIGTRSTEHKSQVPILLRPLVRQYGRYITMAVFGLLLAGTVLLFFLRAR